MQDVSVVVRLRLLLLSMACWSIWLVLLCVIWKDMITFAGELIKQIFSAMILFCIFTFCLYLFMGWLLCDIEPGTEYTWYSGIWHGAYSVINLVRSWFSDALYKAEISTTAYNVWYWISSIYTVVAWIFAGFFYTRKW